MKSFTFHVLLFSTFLTYAQDKSLTSIGKYDIKLSELKNDLGYNPTTDKNLIKGEKEVYDFLFNKLQSKTTIDNTIKNKIAPYLNNKEAALIFLFHPIEMERLEYKTSKASIRAKLNARFSELKGSGAANGKINEVESYIEELKNRQKLLKAKLHLDKGSPSASELAEMEKTLPIIKDLEGQIQVNESLLKDLKNELNKVVTEHNSLFNQYIEKKEVVSYIYQNVKTIGKFDNKPSFKDIKNLLIISLGGIDDLAKATIEIEEKESALQTSFTAVNEILEKLGSPTIPKGILASQEDDDMKLEETDPQIQILFKELITDKNPKAPYDLSLNIPNQEKKIKYEITETNYLLFSFGFAANYIKPTFFEELPTGNITVKALDEDKFQKSFKGNLYLLLDFAPWGRDLNKLGTSQQGNREKWSLCLGVKASKDPLQSLVLGVNYAINKNTKFLVGFSYNSEPKVGAELNTKNIVTTSNYLLDNIAREYKPGFFFGITITPLTLSSLIGADKK